MPGGVNSPVRAFKGLGLPPLVVKEGRGDLLIDVDEKRYIDFCQGWGSLILGHSPPSVVAALQEQLVKGTSFGIATPYEMLLAEKIVSHMPSLQKIRFLSSGTEATMSAIRLARGFTDRSFIVKFDGHFHGHVDALLIQAGSGVYGLPKASSLGVPREVAQLTLSLPFNDVEGCRCRLRAMKELAAVIVEPVAGNMGVVSAKSSFLQMLREETKRQGALLIFDEVITGFRMGLKGAQGHFGIEPDLTCLGKVIGGGLPAAAVGGRAEVMDLLAPLGGVYQAGTLSGNPLAMCAGRATLCEVEKKGFYDVLNEKTEEFLLPMRELVRKKGLPLLIQSTHSFFTFFFGVTKVESRADLLELDEARFRDFFTFLFKRGIYLSPSAYEAHFLSSAHTKEHLAYAQAHIMAYLNLL